MALAVGTKAPDFSLATKTADGPKQIKLSDNFRAMADDRPALCSCAAGSHLIAVTSECTVTKCWEESPNTIRQRAA